MNRIEVCFQKLKEEKRSALICFLTAGDPSFEESLQSIYAVAEAGADIIELGMPFSDAMADGPVIQQSYERALQSGMTLTKVLNLIKRIREKTQVPLMVMGYANPICHYGIDRFAQDLKTAGADGALVVDLPPEESKEMKQALDRQGLKQIFLLSPTSDRQRIKTVTKCASGFIYYISLEGITGAQMQEADKISAQMDQIRRQTDLPIAVGFGVRTVDHVRKLIPFANGIVVGSALIERLVLGNDEGSRFVKELRSVL